MRDEEVRSQALKPPKEDPAVGDWLVNFTLRVELWRCVIVSLWKEKQ